MNLYLFLIFFHSKFCFIISREKRVNILWFSRSLIVFLIRWRSHNFKYVCYLAISAITNPPKSNQSDTLAERWNTRGGAPAGLDLFWSDDDSSCRVRRFAPFQPSQNFCKVTRCLLNTVRYTRSPRRQGFEVIGSLLVQTLIVRTCQVSLWSLEISHLRMIHHYSHLHQMDCC